MKKINMIVFCLLLAGCTKTTQKELALSTTSIEPVLLSIIDHANSDNVVQYEVSDQKTVNKIVDYFNQAVESYPITNNKKFDYQFIFQDDKGKSLTLTLYDYENDEPKYNAQCYQVCIDESKICSDMYFSSDIASFIKTEEITEAMTLEILKQADYNLSSKVLPFLSIEENFSHTNDIKNTNLLITQILRCVPYEEKEYFYYFTDGTASNYQRSIESVYYDERFDFIPFSSFESTGRKIFEQFEMPELVQGEITVDPDYQVYVDQTNQGFQVLEQPNYYKNARKGIRIISEVQNNDCMEYTLALVDVLELQEQVMITSLGKHQKENVMFEYLLSTDELAKEDLFQVSIRDDKISKVEMLQNADKIKIEQPLSKSDFIFNEGENIGYLDYLKIDSNVVDVKSIEYYLNRYHHSTLVEENSEFLSIINHRYLEDKIVESFLFDRKTGQNLSEAELNERFDNRLIEQVNEKISREVKEVCPKYYEDAYLIEECYDPIVIKEKSNKFYDDVMANRFYVKEDGKLVINVLIRKQGGFDRFIEISVE